MLATHHDVLAGAAAEAVRAPSVFNTQPWLWTIDEEWLDLGADRDRQLSVIDPHGRLLLLSCGISLHHARVAIATRGYQPMVRRWVAGFDDDRLARVSIGSAQPADRAAVALNGAISVRRTDRRGYSDEPVPPSTIDELRAAALTEGARVHVLTPDQLPVLSMAAARAAAEELSNPDYRGELMRWTNRPEWSSDGVPANTTVEPGPRRVPLRSLAMEPKHGIPVGPGGDGGAAYVVVYGTGDDALDWLTGGEAVSSIMLTATAAGLALAPISDVIEMPRPRALLADVLPETGYPFLVLRCGLPAAPDNLATSPRRDFVDTIGLPPWQ